MRRQVELCIGLELTKLQLLDITRGLSFLHSLEIVHGDLKGVRTGFFSRFVSVRGDLTASRRRIMFSSTSRAVRD